jgi:hypothetical protein
MVRIDSYKLKPLRFELKEAYGTVRAYPVDQEAFLFCRLTQTKTLTPWAIDEIAGLGYSCIDQRGQIITSNQLC